VNTRFTAAAARELLAALQYYRDEAGALVAEHFDDSVRHALTRLVQMPELGSPAPAGLRTWPLRRFPYTLVYRVQTKEVVVIAVAHQRRAAGYWAGRR
jgi:plasmid stabilization system protein ParE